MLASDVMSEARKVYLNDSAADTWGDSVLLPYLQSALGELELELDKNDLPSKDEVSVAITVLAGAVTVALPVDLTFPERVYERAVGESFWRPMEPGVWSPNIQPTSQFLYYQWRENEIRVPPATIDRQVMIEYTKSLVYVTSANSNIPMFNAKPYLAAKTAALAAGFGSGASRGVVINKIAEKYLADLMIIEVKNQPNNPVRRLPFNLRRRRN